jgi:transcriptional regulator with XRE-family HTH domain
MNIETVANTEDDIAAWMRRVMEQHDLSSLAWASKAGVADTSISRFLKHGSPIPKRATLAKLAGAVGLPIPQFDAVPMETVTIPIVLGSVVFHRGLSEARMSSVESTLVTPQYKDAVAATVTADTAAGRGIHLRDLLVIDTARRPQQGNMVAVAFSDGTVGAMEWQMPFLLPRGGTLPVRRADDPLLKIIGVCVELKRSLL